MIKAYLFDFDGTLVDSMPTYAKSMMKILDDNNIEYGSDIVKIITPLGYEGTAKYYIETLGLNMSKESVLKLMNENIVGEYENNIGAKENVIEVLKELKQKGRSLNVLTASPHLMLDPCLKRLGIFDMFDNVWSCDDFNTTKADPQIYIKAAEKIGVDIEEMLFLDDNFNACKNAKISGTKVCGVYDKSSEEYTDEIKNVSHYYINNFDELLKLEVEKNV